MKTPADIAAWIVDSGVAPSAAAGCARRAPGGWQLETGGDSETYFDLASLTKPMAAVSVARAGLDRSRALGELVVDLGRSPAASRTVELLLSHRAGFEAHVPLYEPLVNGESFDRAAALRTAASSLRTDGGGPSPHDGFAPLYSDLGYILAGEALAEFVHVRDAGEAIAELVVGPLGRRGRLGACRELSREASSWLASVAPTEHVEWRGGVVRGVVHDENAWALYGHGAGGHAGMFGTVDAVLSFGCAVLDALLGRPSPLGARESIAWLVEARPGGTLRAGFDSKSNAGSSAGRVLGDRTFGHLGFTGTSLWIDPDAQVVVSLLTNRVHPTRENVAIRAARPIAHDALAMRAIGR